MKVRFTPAARADLSRIRSWISKDDPGRALTFVRELKARAFALTEFSQCHPIAAESASGPIHKITHGRYLLFYRVLPDAVEIIAVRHGAMDTPTFD